MDARSRERSVVRLYYSLSFLDNLNFWLPVQIIFGVDFLGLSYLQTVVLIFAPIHLVGGLLQVPGGAWADRFGRKRSYLAGTVFVLIGHIPFLVTKEFELLLISVPLIGIGRALREGSTEAIVSVATDESGGSRFGRIMARGLTLFYVARIVSSPIGAALYVIDPRLMIVALMASSALAGLCGLLLPEARENAPGRPTTSVMQYVRRTMAWLRTRNDVSGVLLLVAAAYFTGGLLWVAYQPAFQAAGIDEQWFGAVYVAISLASAAGAELFRHFSDRVTARNFLVLPGLAAVTTGGMMIWGSAPLIVIGPLLAVLFTVAAIPLGSAYVGHRGPAELRSTSLSMVGLMSHLATVGSALLGAVMLDAGNYRSVLIAGMAFGVVTVVMALWLGPRATVGADPVAQAASGSSHEM